MLLTFHYHVGNCILQILFCRAQATFQMSLQPWLHHLDGPFPSGQWFIPFWLQSWLTSSLAFVGSKNLSYLEVRTCKLCILCQSIQFWLCFVSRNVYGYVYCSPAILPHGFFVTWCLNMGFNVGWLFLWDRRWDAQDIQPLINMRQETGKLYSVHC